METEENDRGDKYEKARGEQNTEPRGGNSNVREKR